MGTAGAWRCQGSLFRPFNLPIIEIGISLRNIWFCWLPPTFIFK